MKKIAACLLLPAVICVAMKPKPSPSLDGAWRFEMGTTEGVLLFMDGYYTYSQFDKTNKNFEWSTGGTYQLNGKALELKVEFNTQDKEKTGSTESYAIDLSDQSLSTVVDGNPVTWVRMDDGKGALAGLWRFSSRMENGKMNEMKPGPRKTLKLLTGSRFQWMAINPDTKEFFGTGGGTYTFEKGKYTENIEFFSRDNSRVGLSLNFDGKINSNEWEHSGLSSKGDPIHEIWKKEKQ